MPKTECLFGAKLSKAFHHHVSPPFRERGDEGGIVKGVKSEHQGKS
jgi:hypothetical protein